MVAPVAANANWKNQNQYWVVGRVVKKKCWVPMKPLPTFTPSSLILSPKAKANPVIYQAMTPKQESKMLSRMMFFAFLARTLPAQSIAKPHCIKNTIYPLVRVKLALISVLRVATASSMLLVTFANISSVREPMVRALVYLDTKETLRRWLGNRC